MDEEKAKLIKNAPELTLWTYPKFKDENFDKALNKLLKQCDKGKKRSQRKTYSTASKKLLLNIMSAVSPYMRYANKKPIEEIYARAWNVKTTQVATVINAAEKLGWIRKLDYLKEVNPFIEKETQSRFEILDDCPSFSPKTTFNYNFAECMLVHEKFAEKFGTSDFNYNAKDKQADNRLLKKYNCLLLKQSLKYNNRTIINTDFLIRKVKYGLLINNNRTRTLISGRLCGGFWQSINGAKRKKITINDREVCELDYSAMFTTMAYHLHGLDAPKEPYLIEGFERDDVKSLANICFNVTRGGRKQSLINKLKKPKDKNKIIAIDDNEINKLLASFDEFHSDILQFHHKFEIASKLRWIESEIVRDVIEYFTNRGILVLPIHDSFVIAIEHKEKLKELMENTYFKYVGGNPIIH